MRDAKTLSVVEVEQRTAVSALDDMIGNKSITPVRRRFAAPTILKPLATPTCAPANG
jgi:hypothetical protein